MRKYLILGALALALGGCAQFQQALDEAKGVYTFVTTATVTSGQAGIVANAYDAIKGTAVNYANYCVVQKFPQPICSAANRRAVIKAIRAGDAARAQIEAPIVAGQPVAATLYNTLVASINALQSSAVNNTAVKGP